jgi:hypothetical protein
MQLKEFLDESSFIHLISSTQPNRGASLKQLELGRVSKPAVTVRVEPDICSTKPLLHAAITLPDLCGLFNPVAQVRVEPTSTNPTASSRCHQTS